MTFPADINLYGYGVSAQQVPALAELIVDIMRSCQAPAHYMAVGDWTYNTDVAPPIGATDVAVNNEDPALATEMYITSANIGNTDMRMIFDEMQCHTKISIQDKSDATKYRVFRVISLPVRTGDVGGAAAYYTIGIELLEASTTAPANDQACAVVIRT